MSTPAYEISYDRDSRDFRVDFASGAPSLWRRTWQDAEVAALAELAHQRRAAENLAAGEEAATPAEAPRDRYEIWDTGHFDALVWDRATSSSVWRGPREQAEAAWARIVEEAGELAEEQGELAGAGCDLCGVPGADYIVWHGNGDVALACGECLEREYRQNAGAGSWEASELRAA